MIPDGFFRMLEIHTPQKDGSVVVETTIPDTLREYCEEIGKFIPVVLNRRVIPANRDGSRAISYSYINTLPEDLGHA